MGVIAVDETTHQRLELLQAEWSAKDLGEVIVRLLDHARPVPKSMFGSDPDLPTLTRERRDEIWRK